MPTYSWKCTKCGQGTCVISPIAERDRPPEKDSDDCDHDWQRQLDGGAFQLIGKGWFKDGY